MKNVFQFTALILAFVAITASNMTAQNTAQNKAYWENEAKKALGQADRVINNVNQKTHTFTPQELQMMRSTDPRVRQQFMALNAAKQQRMTAAQQQYEAHYNQQWAQSFNTFNSTKAAPTPPPTYTTPAAQPAYTTNTSAPNTVNRKPRYYVRNAAGQLFPVY
jgi:hypothetical protein